MIGEAIMVVWLLIAVPVGVMITGAVIAAGLGWMLKEQVEDDHEGSELVALND
jgi:hypothetical protein